MTNIFSRAFYRESLRRIKGGKWFLIIYLTVSSMFSASTPWICDLMGIENEIIIYSILNSGSYGFIICLFAPLLTLSVFSFGNKRSDSDYYESLPITHKAMAVSGMLAVFFVIAFSITLSVLVYIIFSYKYIGTVVFVNYKGLILELLAIYIASLIGIGAAAIASSVTGTGVASYFTTVVLLFTPGAILAEFTRTVAALDSRLIATKIIPFFNSSSNLYNSFLYGSIDVSDPIPFITSGVIAILGVILATVLFDKRKSEFATHSYTSVSYARAVALILAFSFAVSDTSIGVKYGTVVTDAFVNAFIAVIVYLIFVAITTRKTHSFGTSMLFVPLIFVFSFVFIGGAYFTNTIMSSECRREEMKGIHLISDNDVGEYYYLYFGYDETVDYDEFVRDRVSEIAYDSEEILDLVYSSLDNDLPEWDVGYESEYVAVPLQIDLDYRTIYRYVYFDSNSYGEFNSLLIKEDAFCDLYSNPLLNSVYSYTESYYSHYADDSREIEEALLSEIASKGADSFYLSLSDGSATSWIYAVIDDGYRYRSVCIDISKSMNETLNIANNKDKIKADELLASIRERIGSAEASEDFVWLNLYSDDKLLDGISGYASLSDVTAELNELITLVDNSDFGSNDFVYVSIESDSDLIYGFLRIRSDADPEVVARLIESISKYDGE